MRAALAAAISAFSAALQAYANQRNAVHCASTHLRAALAQVSPSDDSPGIDHMRKALAYLEKYDA